MPGLGISRTLESGSSIAVATRARIIPRAYALDPQTWQAIDDTTLTNFFKNGNADPNFQPAQNALAWARLNAKDPSCRKILEDARSIMPELAPDLENGRRLPREHRCPG